MIKHYYKTYPAALILFFFLTVFFTISLCLPTDDLLRDVLSWKYGFDYTKLFPYAPLNPQYNQYIGFDYLMYLVQRVAGFGIKGQNLAVHISQVISFIGFYLAGLYVFDKYLSRFQIKNKDFWMFIIICGVVSSTIGRIIIGRPEMWFTIWAISALGVFYRGRTSKIVWIIMGLIMVPLYWLALLYTPFTILVFRSKLKSILLFLTFVIVNITFWQMYSNGLWIHNFELLKLCFANRIPTLLVAENESAYYILTMPLFIVILYLSLIKLKGINLKARVKTLSVNYILDSYALKLIIVISFYLFFINMVRYIGVLSFLFLALGFNIFNDLIKDFNIPEIPRNIIYLVLAMVMVQNVKGSTSIIDGDYHIPRDSKVLVLMRDGVYAIPYFNKSPIQIVPSMEIGGNKQWVQKILVTALDNGVVNCDEIQHRFDYVAEKSLTNIPTCLDLYQVNGDIRIWKIKQ